MFEIQRYNLYFEFKKKKKESKRLVGTHRLFRTFNFEVLVLEWKVTKGYFDFICLRFKKVPTIVFQFIKK